MRSRRGLIATLQASGFSDVRRVVNQGVPNIRHSRRRNAEDAWPLFRVAAGNQKRRGVAEHCINAKIVFRKTRIYRQSPWQIAAILMPVTHFSLCNFHILICNLAYSAVA